MMFEIVYDGQTIAVTPGMDYRLDFPNGRCLLLNKRPDDTKTTPVENANISYSVAYVWAVKDPSSTTAWLSTGQLQLIGALIEQKEKIIATDNLS